MAEASIPYMASVKNVPDLLNKIRSAGTPPKFSHEFLSNTLGFTSSSDRGVIKVLKALGFLSLGAIPLPRYNEFRGETGRSPSLAAGLREGWAPIFLADEDAQRLSSSQLVEGFKNVTGSGEAVAKKMATTFKAFSDQADWTADSPAPRASTSGIAPPEGQRSGERPGNGLPTGAGSALSLHQDVHIHLPPSTDVATYSAIFRALRDELLG